MTKEQIDNFRKAMILEVGPYALMMPDEDVIKMRNNLQSKLNESRPIKGR